MRNRYLPRTLGVHNFGEGQFVRNRHEAFLFKLVQFRRRAEFVGALQHLEASTESFQRSSLLRKYSRFAGVYEDTLVT